MLWIPLYLFDKKFPIMCLKPKPRKFLSGPREREPSIIRFLPIPKPKEFWRSRRPFWTWSTSISKLFQIKANQHSVSNSWGKERVTAVVSHQGDLEWLIKQEPTQFGILDQKSFWETEQKFYTFLHFWSLTTERRLMIKLYSERLRKLLRFKDYNY